MNKERIKKLKAEEDAFFAARKEFKRAARKLLSKAARHLAPHIGVTKPTETVLEGLLDDFMSSNMRVL